MNQYVTAVLLICATLMGQGQPAHIHFRLLEQQAGQELSESCTPQPLRRTPQLRLLAQVDLRSAIQAVTAAYPQQLPASQPPARYGSPRLSQPRDLPALRLPTALLLRGP